MLLYLLSLNKDNYLELRLCHGLIVDFSLPNTTVRFESLTK